MTPWKIKRGSQQPKDTKKCICGSTVNASNYVDHIRDCPVVLKERRNRKQLEGTEHHVL